MPRFQKYFLIVLVLALGACGTNPEQQVQDDRTVFRYNEAAGITSLDPSQARNLENIWAINQIFNGLVQVNSQMEVMPCIAESWEISADGREYTFHLRNDVRFHDHPLFEDETGRLVVADDFVYSFWRILDPNTASAGRTYLNMLDKNASNNYLGMKAVDDHTLKMYLTEPFPPFLDILAMQYFSVVPGEVAEHYGVDFRRNPVGTGPFMFKMWKEDVKLVLLKNPNYFEVDENGVQLPYLDAVSVSFIRSHVTAFQEFVHGKFDFHSGITGDVKDKAMTPAGQLMDAYEGKFNMQKAPYLKTDYIGILIDDDMEIVQESALRHKAVRQAISHAIDREELIYSQRKGVGRPAAAGFVPSGIPVYDANPVQGLEYDIDKARRLLAEAGYSDQNQPKVTLTTTEAYRDLVEYLQSQLKEIGLLVEINIIETPQARYQIETGQVNFFRKSWIADYRDAENFLQIFLSENWTPNGSNYFHYSNAEFDTLYVRAMAEPDEALRNKIYSQMDQILVEDAVAIPLFYDEAVRFVKPEVTGLEMNPMNLLILKHVKKTND